MGEYTGSYLYKEVMDLKLSLQTSAILSMIYGMQKPYFHLSNKVVAERLNLSRRTVERSISELADKKLISITGNTSSRIITTDRDVVAVYRQRDGSTTVRMTDTSDNVSQTTDRVADIYKDSKDSNIYNKEKPKKIKPKKHKYGEYSHILLTDDEYEKLKDKVDDRNKWIGIVDEGIELKGYKYQSHYLAILKWYKGRDKYKSTTVTKGKSAGYELALMEG